MVVVPLLDESSDFGQTTIVQALSLGKPVVATRSPGVVDYVTDGREGFLVAADSTALRAAIARLEGDADLRRACGEHALERSRASTYTSFAERLVEIVVSGR